MVLPRKWLQAASLEVAELACRMAAWAEVVSWTSSCTSSTCSAFRMAWSGESAGVPSSSSLCLHVCAFKSISYQSPRLHRLCMFASVHSTAVSEKQSTGGDAGVQQKI